MTARVRVPRFAGRFYDAEPRAWAARCDRARRRVYEAPRARLLLLPHGGACDGPMAAGLAALAPARELALLGPVHDPAPGPAALLSDPRLGAAVAGARYVYADPLPGATPDPGAHDREHSLEVLAAWLAGWGWRGALIPTLVSGRPDKRTWDRWILGMADWMRGSADRGMLVTTDLDHYHRAAEGRRLHAATLARLEAGDPESWLDAVDSGQLSPCGGPATGAFLALAARLGWTARVLAYGWGGAAPGETVGFAAAAALEE